MSMIVHKTKKPEQNSDLYIYNPESFDPESYHGVIGRHPDAARWLLNCIYFRHVIRNYDHQAYVNLNADLLAKVMGDRSLVRAVREAMIESGLVESDHCHIKGVKSIGYRIGPALSGAQWRRYYPNGKRSQKRIGSYLEESRQPRNLSLPVHHHLVHWLSRVEVVEDYQARCQSIPEPHRATQAEHQLAEIKRGGYACSVCRYGRVHTPYTSLVSEARGCLSFDGCQLWNVDIKNSQPYFLALIVIESCLFGKNVTDCEAAMTHLYCHDNDLFLDQFFSQKEGEKPTHPPGPHNPLVFESPEYPDLGQLARDTTDGTLYERLMQETDNQSRSDTKQRFFGYLFGETQHQDTKTGRAFAKLYPTAHQTITRLKTEKTYAWVGQELQRRESRIVIGTICERLRVEHPDIPILTIHDSITTTEDHLDTLVEVMTEEFARLPLQPTFKIERA